MVFFGQVVRLPFRGWDALDDLGQGPKVGAYPEFQSQFKVDEFHLPIAQYMSACLSLQIEEVRQTQAFHDGRLKATDSSEEEKEVQTSIP